MGNGHGYQPDTFGVGECVIRRMPAGNYVWARRGNIHDVFPLPAEIACAAISASHSQAIPPTVADTMDGQPPVRELWPEQIAEELFRLPDPVTGKHSPRVLSNLPIYREVATVLCRMAIERMGLRDVWDCRTCRHAPKDGEDFRKEPCRTCNPAREVRGPYLNWAQKD